MRDTAIGISTVTSPIVPVAVAATVGKEKSMIASRTAAPSRGVHRSVLLALLTLAAVSLWRLPVRAATITVNSTADDTTAGDGDCTLREAIANVNAAADTSDGDCAAATGSDDTVVFDLALPATITLTTDTELEINTNVTINGPTTGVLAVDGNGQVTVFDIQNGTVSIANLTVQNGLGDLGGGIYNDATLTLTGCTLSGNSAESGGGGIFNDLDGTVTLSDCTLSDNSAPDVFGGGGVYNSGTATLTTCTLSGNSAPDAFGGGGIYSDGELTLTGCTLSGNSGVDGGAVYNDIGGTLTLSDSTLSGNSAPGDFGGGGVYNDGTATLTTCTLSGNSAPDAFGGGGIYSDGELTLTGCTLSGNSGVDGGGIFNDFFGTATLTNCTLSGNSAPDDVGGGGVYSDGDLTLTGCTLSSNSGVDGGGVFNDYYGTATLTNCTLSGNSATGSDFGGGGLYNDGVVALTNCTLSGNSAPASDGGGLYNDSDGELTVTNTIVANSTSGGNCADFGDFTDGGHNLDSDGSCGIGPATDPMLDAAGLASNGGPTQTIALQAQSPAINAGDESVCAAPPVNDLDQRGYVRPGTGDTSCSIGAYEYNSPGPPSACVGDCNGDGHVTVDEILTMVNIALGNEICSACGAANVCDDLVITVDEILTAVNNALNECSGTTA
jgi:CSLREA domain-containing protein